METLIRSVACALLSLILAGGSVQAAEIATRTVSTADGAREYLLVTPGTVTKPPYPLVLVLHGHGGTAANVLGLKQRASPLAAWVGIAEREHILVAALQGASSGDGRPGWNDCRRKAPGNPQVDDVAFAHAVVGELQAKGLLDTQRIYVMGMSNGAMMAHRLALELTPPVAAIAAASGTLPASSVCAAPQHPVSVLVIHGTADPIVPYSGGAIRILGRTRGWVGSVDETLAFWRHADGLDEAATTTALPHNGSDATRVVRTRYGSDPAGLQVELLRVEGGGHVEPSTQDSYGALYSRLVGPQNHDLESAEEAWRFFAPKRLPK